MRILLLGIFFLSGCANVAFDGGEYDRFVSIAHFSSRVDCSNPSTAKPMVDIIDSLIKHELVYSKYKWGSSQVFKATQNLNSIISTLQAKYSSNQVVSVEFCKSKMENIADGAERILNTLGAF